MQQQQQLNDYHTGWTGRKKSFFLIYRKVSQLGDLEVIFFSLQFLIECLNRKTSIRTAQGSHRSFSSAGCLEKFPHPDQCCCLLLNTAVIQYVLSSVQESLFSFFPFSSLYVLVVFTSLTADRSQKRDLSLNIHLSSCLSVLPFYHSTCWTTCHICITIYAITCLQPHPASPHHVLHASSQSIRIAHLSNVDYFVRCNASSFFFDH